MGIWPAGTCSRPLNLWESSDLSPRSLSLLLRTLAAPSSELELELAVVFDSAFLNDQTINVYAAGQSKLNPLLTSTHVHQRRNAMSPRVSNIRLVDIDTRYWKDILRPI